MGPQIRKWWHIKVVVSFFPYLCLYYMDLLKFQGFTTHARAGAFRKMLLLNRYIRLFCICIMHRYYYYNNKKKNIIKFNDFYKQLISWFLVVWASQPLWPSKHSSLFDYYCSPHFIPAVQDSCSLYQVNSLLTSSQEVVCPRSVLLQWAGTFCELNLHYHYNMMWEAVSYSYLRSLY